jgi:D-3-phosphoglycerate dehydrogenase
VESLYNIKTLNKIANIGLNLFEKGNYSIDSKEDNYDGIVLRSFNMHDMEFSSDLKAIARAGAGVNNIPLEKCTEKGVVVFNTPGANANGVKELLLLSLLISSRKVYQGITWANSLKGSGEQVPKLVEQGKSKFQGPEIKGKTLGVIGLGAIGVMVANDASALKMNVIGFDPFLSIDSAWGLSRKINKAPSLEYLLANSDYITIHVPQNDKTKGMFNTELINTMKHGVKIINLSRSGLIVNKDIIEALESGVVSSYVTDFPEDELLGVNGVIPIPHLGASTPESEDNCAVMAVEQIKEYLENGNIINSVNFPNCTLERTSENRLTILHRNIPNMIGQITGVLAKFNMNISDMLNKHKNNVAYTIIESEEELNSQVLQELGNIDGILKVRVIKGSN